MIIIGPDTWVDWMKEKTAGLEIASDVMLTHLSYDDSFEKTLAGILETESACSQVYIYSTGRLGELGKHPELGELLGSPRTVFVNGMDDSLIARLRQDFSRPR